MDFAINKNIDMFLSKVILYNTNKKHLSNESIRIGLSLINEHNPNVWVNKIFNPVDRLQCLYKDIKYYWSHFSENDKQILKVLLFAVMNEKDYNFCCKYLKIYSRNLFRELRSLDYKIYYLREVKELKGEKNEKHRNV